MEMWTLLTSMMWSSSSSGTTMLSGGPSRPPNRRTGARHRRKALNLLGHSGCRYAGHDYRWPAGPPLLLHRANLVQLLASSSPYRVKGRQVRHANATMEAVPYPQFDGKHAHEALYSPLDSLKYERGQGLPEFPHWDAAVLFYQRSLLRWVVETETTASGPGWWPWHTVHTQGGLTGTWR